MSTAGLRGDRTHDVGRDKRIEKPGHVYMWEYRVREDSIAQFEQAYGPDGEWVGLFQHASGFLRTELHRDTTDPRRYFTIDYWDSEESYLSFRERFASEFKDLDKRCEALTWEEGKSAPLR